MENSTDVNQPAVHIRALAITVHPTTVSEVVHFITTPSPNVRLLLAHNLHSAYLFQVNSKFRDLYSRADKVIIDGAPILWLAKRATQGRSLDATHRQGSTDWIAQLPATAGLRLFVYGASVESNSRAVDALREQLPQWAVQGIDGYTEEAKAIRHIADFRPDLVIIGLGMPRQESFLSRRWQELPPAVYATVGGAIDYVAGSNRLSPRWVGRYGLEWLWRLVHEPRRLGERYLIEPFRLLPHVVRNLSRKESI